MGKSIFDEKKCPKICIKKAPKSTPKKTRFLTSETLAGMFSFPADMARIPAEVNQLNNQVLVRYFESEWRKVIR